MTDFIFLGSKITVDGDCSLEIKRCLLLGRKAVTNLDSILKSSWQHSVIKIPYIQSYGFPSSCVQIWDLDHKEGWALTNWCVWTAVLENTLESPLDIKIKPVSLRGNHPWIFIERTEAEAEAPIIWPPDMKSRLIGKHPNTGKDWGQEEKGTTKDEMIRWHHWLNGHKFEQTLGDSKGQGILTCCNPCGGKEWDNT